VKLYFLCGLPTETDEDVLAIADLAKRMIQTGREVSGRREIGQSVRSSCKASSSPSSRS
jgi:radical SAM superfamily enzyme YgiQ (UPF0313 family)